MTRLSLAVLLAVALGARADAASCVYWTQGTDTQSRLTAAGIVVICVAPDRVEAWRAAGFAALPITDAELASRQALQTPGTAPRPGLASPTRSPWVVTNGWRFARQPGAKFVYDVPAGKAALAAAEAAAYGVDAVIKIDPADLPGVGAVQTLLGDLAAANLPAVWDFSIVDDGSAITGEVMNLLVRRNLLFQIVQTPPPRSPLTIVIGSAEYPRAEAADPSTFALKIRRQLTDERRSLRVFGSEVVLVRLMADAGSARLHLVNYGGREIEGLRLRVRGTYRGGEAHVSGVGRVELQDQRVADGTTEVTIPRLTTYAIVDLK